MAVCSYSCTDDCQYSKASVADGRQCSPQRYEGSQSRLSVSFHKRPRVSPRYVQSLLSHLRC